jgi:hypothetical protein
MTGFLTTDCKLLDGGWDWDKGSFALIYRLFSCLELLGCESKLLFL